jgi:cytochrome c
MNLRVLVVLSWTMGAAPSLIPAAALAEQSGAKVPTWSGVYSAAQNTRGEEFSASACAQCHGARLNGAGQPDQPPSPAIAGPDFLRKWSGQTAAALFLYVRKMMPSDNPGSLSDQESIDAVAHMLAVSDFPAGDKELPADLKVLDTIVIEQQPKK